MNSTFDNGNGASRVFAVSADFQRDYQVSFTENLLGTDLHRLATWVGSRAALLVTTPTVAKLYGATLRRELSQHGVSVPMLVIQCTESSKTMSQVEYICSQAYAHGLGRKSVMIGMGGGVCTDLVTMAASLVRRGIGYLRIPTTLIGQVDAGIGIKGAVNALHKKSALGCFYPPEAVFLDPSFLRTLALREISAGMAEIIKVAMVCDEHLFRMLEKHGRQLLASRFASPREESRSVLWGSVVRMLEELSGNLYEDRGYARLMDFGHSFSPLLEERSEFRLLHGEAVAIDMALTLALAKDLGALSERSRDRAVSMILACGLPISSDLLTEALCVESFRQTTAHRGGALNFVLPTSSGRAKFVKQAEEIPASCFRSALAWLKSFERLNCRRIPAFPAPINTAALQTRTP